METRRLRSVSFPRVSSTSPRLLIAFIVSKNERRGVEKKEEKKEIGKLGEENEKEEVSSF